MTEARAVPLIHSFSNRLSTPSPEEGTKRHEKATLPQALRMRLNGESGSQMAHADAIKRAGGVSLNPEDGSDTSKDQVWHYDDTPSGVRADRYVLITTVIWLGIKIPILAIPTLLLHFPPMLLVRIYISLVPDGTERIRRSRGFYFIYVCTLILSIPVMIVLLVSFTLDLIMYYFFCILYCTCTWRWKQLSDGFEKIRPYRNGPSIICHLADFFVCCMGQCSRQTAGETLYMVSCMWLLMPWLKYYVNCNPWVYDLDHRLCQQISTEMQDLGTSSDVADTARIIISRARQARSTANRVDLWSFVPHYPYPPPDRRWALGLQAGGSKYPGKFTLIVHTTHAVSEVQGSTEQFVLSNSCEEPIYRVMLWYSNPFHFLTGWVEASVSTGLPSQPNKRAGGEHPMWLVTPRTRMVAGRDSWTGSGMIDAFFDYWLPVFVHEMRRLTFSTRLRDQPDGEKLALQIADAHYQEVHSKDGVSRPKSFLGRMNYCAKDALTEFQANAEEQRSDVTQMVANTLSSLANTNVARWASAQLQGEDLHAPGHIMQGISARTMQMQTVVERMRGEEA